MFLAMGEREELDAIWHEHAADLADRVARLRSAAAAAASGPIDDDLRAIAVAEAHTLAGTAALFGRSEAARLAREVEVALRDQPPGLDASGVVVSCDALARALTRPG
jgi:HPt (histidine-containing phosphotransfer) domain-containing protein